MTTTTWDPNAQSGITLSNGSLTATATSSGGKSARSTTSRTAGKAYVEFTLGQVAPSSGTRIGIANSLWDYSQSAQLGREANSFDQESDGSIYVAGDSAGEVNTLSPGDVVQLCVDFDAQFFWLTKNNTGNWNGTNADPVSGSGGIDFSTMAGFTFYVGYCSATTGDSVTANFGASAFTYAVPSGFSSWNSQTTRTTWDPNAESGLTLSTGNLTATVTASATDGMSARSLTSWNTGKAYIEFTMGQVAPSGATRIGVANSSWNYTQSEMLGRDANSFDYGSNGSVFVANTNVTSFGSIAAGDIVQLCVDFDAKLFWFGKNNTLNWNGTNAHPAAGTGGISFSSITGPYFVGYCSPTAGDNATANFGASAFAYTPPSGFAAWGGGHGGGLKRPAALANYPTWTHRRNWKFGTNQGNNIKTFRKLAEAGWIHSNKPHYNNPVEVQLFNTDMQDTNANVQPLANYFDFLAIWAGALPIEAPPSDNVTSMEIMLPLDAAVPGLTSVAYIQGTFKCPKVKGAWPAWWTIGHSIGGAPNATTWGPEIDVVEVAGKGQVSDFNATLHCMSDSNGNELPNSCFRSDSPPLNIPPAATDNDAATYHLNSYNLGTFEIQGIDASVGFHTYGCLIEPDHTISIWIDDQKMGHFDATQYCHDDGTPVALNLMIDLALANQLAGGDIDSNDFGSANNTGPTNKFRLSFNDIQIWGPPS
ncbi:MAG: hypothetical protein JOZ13_07140 [Alphaproteobacteria bacterium]|nr:hypothetical protein [Alphaproteobacteria bacterium]